MKSLLIAIALINFYVASINASPLDKVYNAYLQNTEDNSNQIGKHQGGRHQNHQSHQPFRAINGANDDDNAAGDDDDDDEDRLMTFLSQTFSPQFVRHLEHADLTDYNGDDDEDDGDIFEDKNEPNRILKRSNHLKDLELCRNVNCNNIHSNGAVSKQWRQAQLTTCCPSYRKKFISHYRKNYMKKKSPAKK